MSDIVSANAVAYAARHQLRLGKQLGSGKDGTVLLAENKCQRTRSAIKALKFFESYARERDVYARLRDFKVTEVLGFHVPQPIRTDDDLRVIEMSIVTRPFVLDFAGAVLNARPTFPAEDWDLWEADRRENFGEDRWKTVQAVMDAFEEMGIYLIDVSPSNIAFD